ncbi:MAG: hypothetical protein M3Y60_05965, partial [Bacteroidota bacterium]|nr:hypothetical protein [Bacteroidota bacterium]
GAGQLQYLRQLIEARPFFERVPDQSIITDARNANDRIQATRGIDYILVYSSQGKKFTVNTGKISGRELVAHWYSPRNGEVKDGGRHKKSAQLEFAPPTSGYGQDWVLILDDAAKNYSLPTGK